MIRAAPASVNRCEDRSALLAWGVVCRLDDTANVVVSDLRSVDTGVLMPDTQS